jgi:hypothetical protein
VKIKSLIYRKRIKKSRYGIGFGRQSFQIHFGKRSWYFMIPFYNVKSIRDIYGMVDVKAK